MARFMRRKRMPKKGKKALATKSFVRKLVHKESETKYFDYAQSGQFPDYNGSVYAITTAVPIGTADTQRIGDKLTMRGMQFRITSLPGTAACVVRYVIAQYKGNTDIGAPTVATLIQGAYLGTSNAVNAPYAHDWKNTWTILLDKSMEVNTVNKPNPYRSHHVPFKYAKKILALVAAGTTAQNHIYLLVLSNLGPVSAPSVTYVTRLLYDDA